MGTIGAGVEVFDKPMTPAEIHRWVRNLSFDFDLDQYHFMSRVFNIGINKGDKYRSQILFSLYHLKQKIFFYNLANCKLKRKIIVWPLITVPSTQKFSLST